MEFSDVIQKRRAVRNYEDKTIERTTIEKLIGSAILAPSAMNLQPWAFAAVVDRQKVDEYAKHAKEWLLTSLATSSYDPSVRHMLEDPNFTVFHHAPALVLILAKSPASQAAEDCCLAAENFMLAAREEGLGTCWVGFARPWLDLASTKAELGLSNEYHVVAPIILGYPKEWPESPGRSPAEIHWLPGDRSNYASGPVAEIAGRERAIEDQLTKLPPNPLMQFGLNVPPIASEGRADVVRLQRKFELTKIQDGAGPVKLTVHCPCKKSFHVEYLNYQSILRSQVKCRYCGRGASITEISPEDVRLVVGYDRVA